jgi:perosamine synthetase
MKKIPVCEPFLNGHELRYITDAVKSNWISSKGEYIHKFEKAFAAYCDMPYGVGVCNGTAALHLALRCLDIGPGTEVIIPSFTMISTAFAVCYTGAMPVFVDADPQTWNIAVEKIEKKITKKTKAILPVHIYGLPCDMSAIQKLAKKYKLYVIEDAAEAHGATISGKKVGSLSDIAAFSFYANKNLTTGEGGMVVTRNKKLYQKALYFKNLCFALEDSRTYIHNDIGFNYRLSNLHAAIGLAQLEKAEKYKNRRIAHGKLYKELLQKVPGIITQEYNEDIYTSVFWMNGIIIDPYKYGHSRDKLMSILADKYIETRIFFTGMHRQPALKRYGCDISEKFTVTDHLTKNGLYLPSGSGLDTKQIRFICKIIQENSRGY